MASIEFECAGCGKVASAPTGHVNRSRKRGVRLFCGIGCFAVARTKPTKPKVRKIKPEPALFEAAVREWRVLREFPDYEISNDGRLRRATAGSNTKAGAHIRVSMGTSKPSYPTYGLVFRGTGKRVSRNAHRLVAAEFLDPPSEGQTNVLHHDDNRLNCVDTNLKWGTEKDNKVDAKRNNRLPCGPDHPSTKKPWTRPRGEAHSSAKFGVDDALIGRIRQGKIWKHLTNPEYKKMLKAGSEQDAA